jgi:hypothetical protein
MAQRKKGERMIRFPNLPGFALCRETDLPSSLDFSLQGHSHDISSVSVAPFSPETLGPRQEREIRYGPGMNFCVPQYFLVKNGTGENPFLFILGRTIGSSQKFCQIE